MLFLKHNRNKNSYIVHLDIGLVDLGILFNLTIVKACREIERVLDIQNRALQIHLF